MNTAMLRRKVAAAADGACLHLSDALLQMLLLAAVLWLLFWPLTALHGAGIFLSWSTELMQTAAHAYAYAPGSCLMAKLTKSLHVKTPGSWHTAAHSH